MNKPLDQFSPVEIGERLRLAREDTKLTQAEAAAALNMARTTLVAIEQGQRRTKIDEIHQLAKLYGKSVNSLLHREVILTELTPRFRKLFNGKDSGVEDAVRLLSDLAKAEAELENLLGVTRLRNYPPERSILPGDVRAQAEQDALELRQWLGLGLRPIGDIFSLLELELGMRVYVRRLDSKISGLFAYDEALGACMLLNASHPRDRRAQSAAHEMAHFLTMRRQVEVLQETDVDQSREERYAVSFARSFLTPARAVMQKFSEITAGSSKLTRRHVIVLAHYFGVSREAVVRRLEELKLTKSGTWDWFKANGGIIDAQVRQVLGELAGPDRDKSDADRPTTLRLSLLAAEAWNRELLTEGQLAQMLHLDRVEVRKLFDDLEIEGGEADGAPILPA
jgi:Zn-dependent peptidase ImmA (M78 family)/DNA-binding XRE family transcriptional regulator